MSWEPDSSSAFLPDEGEITIKKAFFGPQQDYQDGTVCLAHFWFECPGFDFRNPETKEQRAIVYSMGKGWKGVDQGRRAVKEGGEPSTWRIHGQSNLYRNLIKPILDLGGGEALAARGEPFEASTWEGLTFFATQQERTSVGEGNREFKKNWLIPVDLRDGKKKAPAASSEDIEAKAIHIAQTEADYDDYTVEAMRLVKGMGDKNLRAKLLSEEFFNEHHEEG